MTAPAEASEQRELLIDELSDLPVQDFTLAQLHRLAKALENALDDVETEFMRRDDPPQDWT
jgi:hypothetical protein